MDLLIRGGDLELDHRGEPVALTGDRALLQRAAIRLGVRRGSLPGDPAFGSRLHRLGRAGGRQALEALALAAVREALAPMGELQVRSAECAADRRNGRLLVRLQLEARGRALRMEVTV